MIFHIADRRRWHESLQQGTYTASTRDLELADEGFIHCSTSDQVAGVLQRFYQGVADLVLLHVDETLLAAPLVYEQLGEALEPFPHIYGPLNTDAVVQVDDPLQT